MSKLYVCKEYETPYEEGYTIITTLDKHNSDLLDKVAEKFRGRIRLRELTRAETMDIFDEVIAEIKAEVSK